MTALLASLLGGLFGLAVATTVLLARRAEAAPEPRSAAHAGRRWRWRWRAMLSVRAAAALAAGALAWVLSGWPVAGAAAAALVWWAPVLARTETAHQEAVARIDAAAAWVESLRDNLTAAAGLEQTMLTSARRPPPALTEPVTALGDDLRAGTDLATALERFAARVDDPTVDDAVIALTEAADAGGSLAEILTEAATEAREEAARRMRVHAGRARPRGTARIIAVTITGFLIFLVAFGAFAGETLLADFDTVVGQGFLALGLACFGGGLAYVHRLGQAPRLRSFLRPEATP